jgi:hypothetical protein
MKVFNLNTVTILKQITTTQLPGGIHKYLVKGKLIGGKRWKRDYALLSLEDIRHIKMNKIGI